MNNAEIRQLRILGGLLSSQKERVADLVNHDKLRMSPQAINFSKALMAGTGHLRSISNEHINRVYERSFQNQDDSGEYALIAHVLKSEISK
ncbi:hypothetical protein ABK905_14820 [Acerihabitans sp. KWT182]|uniref:Uncharacterized protein n=1 Tax=Acerihabitans sp. KWT182 TaxID=3157919 RepID=A0AAU7Q557_9GAMM